MLFEDNPLAAEKVDSGQRLFFDRHISCDGSMANASRHDRGAGALSPWACSGGARWDTPAIVNCGYARLFFWTRRRRRWKSTIYIRRPYSEEAGLYDAPILDAWCGLFKTGQSSYYFELLRAAKGR